jgi:Metallo-peptidase family M12B Reprolysin-like
MKISPTALPMPTLTKVMPVKTGSVGLPLALSKGAATAKPAANTPSYAAPALTPWVMGRPGNEMSATTGLVNGQATSVPLTLSLKKGAAYSFTGAYAYSYTGKAAPVVTITLTDAQGKVVSSSKGNALNYVATADGNFTVTMAITPAKGFTAQFTNYRLNANQTLSKLPTSSGDKYVDAVLAGGSNWWHEPGNVATPTNTSISPAIKQLDGARQTISYGFLSGNETYLSAADKKNFDAINADQKTAIQSAFDYLSGLINVDFVLDNTNADIRFGNNDQTASAGYANYPSTDPNRPSVLMLDNSDNEQNKGANLGVKGGYGWETLIHEIGHTMGLKHPGAYNAGGGTTAGPYLPSAIDNRAMSIMSYNNPTASNIVTLTGTATAYSYSLRTNIAAANPDTFQTFDIAALQYIYGANTNTTAQTVSLNDSFQKFQTLWAPQGVTINAGETTRENLFDLRAGAYSSVSVRTEAHQLAGFKSQLMAQGFDDSKASAAASSVMSSLKAKKTDTTLYNGKNALALSYGSKVTAVVGGSAADKFYASNYNTEIDGGQGADTLYLQGTVKDWTIDRDRGLATAKTGGATIKFRNVEAIGYYMATDALLHA